MSGNIDTVEPVLSGHSKRTPKIGFQYRLSLNAGQKYCRMLPFRSKVFQNAPGEHSAILLTFIKLSFVIKTFVFSIFKWPLKTGFNVGTRTMSAHKLSHCLTHLSRKEEACKITQHAKKVIIFSISNMGIFFKYGNI